MRLILDTHVWLDWLVFRDRRLAMLIDAIEAGQVRVLATEAMLQEFAAVITRPIFALDAVQRAAAAETQRKRVQACQPAPDCRLACTDRNDQMFIDLAVAHRADWLLSRDKALLRLRRQAQGRFGVRIDTPERWLALNAEGTVGGTTDPKSTLLSPPLRST